MLDAKKQRTTIIVHVEVIQTVDSTCFDTYYNIIRRAYKTTEQ